VIVTRRRKPRSHPGRYLIPLGALAVVGFLLGWPPSQHAIANGPLQPVWNAGANAGAVVMRPLSFAGQQQTIADRNREIRDLNDRLERQRQGKADAETRTQQLQQQVTALANQPHAAPVVLPRAIATPGFGSVPASAGTATGDEKRLAATWSAMEPEKAAAVVQRLPDDEVVRVLAAMDPDSAGAIMNALPAGVAARISRAVAQVQPAASR
jgi:flagellar motility protein MotE (MotC chaperone)